MKKNYRIGLWVIGILFIPVTYYFVERYDKYLKSHPIRYCYEEFYGPPNAVLIVKDEDDIPELIEHYQKMENHIEDYISFDLRTLSVNDPVHLLGYPTKDSLVAEVISFYNYGKFGGDRIRGYIYAKSLHVNPPENKN